MAFKTDIGSIIKASVGDNGYVARYTGKEFAILLPKYNVYAAKTLTESIQKQIF
ncbi:MAG: diguanylate cyclase [Lachnospiraceae bacterium]|nr:diguanylate cyclase [Lachnospiraceae bacterium]